MASEVEIQIIAIDAATNIIEKIGSEFGVLGSLAVSALTAAGSAMDFLIQKGIEEQDAVAKLNAMLAATGGVSGMTSQSLQDLAGSLAMVTRFSDDSIIAAETVLLRFKSLGSQYFPEATKAALNLATVMGVDASQAARQLGVALESPTTGLGLLRRAGIVFTEEQKKQIEALDKAGKTEEAQKLILDSLANTVGGLAEAMGKTFQGQWDIFNNKLDMAWQEMGVKLLPVLTPLIDDLTKLADQVLPILADVFDKDVIPAVKKFAGVIEQILNGRNPFDMFKDWVNNVDWKKASDDLAAGIDNIDWAGLGNKVHDDAITLSQGISKAISEVDWQALGSSIGNAFVDGIQGALGGRKGGVQETVKQLFVVVPNLFQPMAPGTDPFAQMQKEQAQGLQSGKYGNSLFNQIQNWFNNMFGGAGGGGAQSLNTSNIIQQMVNLRTNIQNEINQIGSSFNNLKLSLQGIDIGATISSWIPNIDTALKQIVNLFFTRGQNMVAKMIDGINGMKAGITTALNNLMALIAGLIKSFSIPISLALPSLGPLESLIAQIAGLTTGGAHGYSNLGGGGGGKGGTVKTRASGGVINEPVIGVGLRTGSAWSFAERGDEVVLPHGSGGSAPIIINLSINSMFSLADKSKAESELTPIILKAVRNARAANI